MILRFLHCKAHQRQPRKRAQITRAPKIMLLLDIVHPPFFPFPRDRVLCACRALILGNAKSILVLARCKSASSTQAGLLSIKSECISRPDLQNCVCREKRGGRGYRSCKVLDDTSLLVAVWTPPNGLHMSYARYKMANIL